MRPAVLLVSPLAFVLLAAGAGLLWPRQQLASQADVILAALVFVVTLTIAPDKLWAARRAWPRTLVLVLLPLVTLLPVSVALGQLFTGAEREGLLSLGLASTEVATVALVAIAAGNAALALLVCVFSLVATAVAAPLLAPWLTDSEVRPGELIVRRVPAARLRGRRRARDSAGGGRGSDNDRRLRRAHAHPRNSRRKRFATPTRGALTSARPHAGLAFSTGVQVYGAVVATIERYHHGAGEPRLRIGAAAQSAGVNVQTLRYYERRRLLAPERRHSGHRSYGLQDVQLVRSIRAAQSLGFTLAEIEEILTLTHRRGSSVGEIGERAARKIADIDTRIGRLQAMRTSLQTLIDLDCDSLTDCSCRGPGCPVKPDTDERPR